MIHDIKENASTIDRGIAMIDNANVKIKKTSIEAEAYKIMRSKKTILQHNPQAELSDK